MHHEKGFDFISYPCASGKPEALVVILHGHNSNPLNYRHLAQKTQDELGEVDVLIVRGPVKLKATTEEKAKKGLPEEEDLYSWLDMQKKRGKQTKLLLRTVFNRMPVIDKLNAFIDHQLKQRGLKDENLALMGFSMGGAMAVHTAAKRPKKCAAVVCHSGTVLPLLKTKSKPDTLVIMGDKDDLFYEPQHRMAQGTSRLIKAFQKAGVKVSFHHNRALKRLQKAGIPVTAEVIKDLTHRVSDETWDKANTFVGERLKKKPQKKPR